MSRLIDVFLRATLCMTVFVLLSQDARSSDDNEVVGFLAASKGWLPTRPVIVVREAEDRWAGVDYAGLDPGTGAWFRVARDRAGGRNPDGTTYYLRRGGGEPVEHPEPVLPMHIGTLMPASILASLHERPEMIVAVERDGDLWKVTYESNYEAGSGRTSTTRARAEFSSETGRMLRHTRLDMTPPHTQEFEFTAEGVERAIRDKDSVPFGYRLEEGVSGEDFWQAAVLPRMEAAHLATEQKLAAISAGYTQNSSGEWSPPSGGQQTTPYAGRGVMRFRTPLILLGAILVGIAAIEMYRRRSAA